VAETLLALDDVRAGYGDAVVLDGITLAVAEGGSLAVLGRNGVGKSTLLLTIMGFTRVSRGAIAWRGRDITRAAPHWRARNGLGWVAQEREIFPSLSVEENLLVAARPGRWDLEAVYGLFPRLRERRGSRGNHLSGGEQQMLAIGRCLMGAPELVMFDEPSLGLAPAVVQQLLRTIRDLNREGLTCVLVEQNVAVSLKLAAHAYVLENGRITLSGPGEALLADDRVRRAYLGL
jgi:branched-chain amino acid transport system ATP-binding protein